MTLSGFHDVSIGVEDEPDPAAVDAVNAGLVAYNLPFVGVTDMTRHRPIAVFARRGAAVVGGAVGHTAWGWLFLRNLWVDEARRGSGLGTALLGEFETAGRGRGCSAAWLDTFSFQARPFYEKLGYRQFGELVGYPAGSDERRHFLWKPLDSREEQG